MKAAKMKMYEPVVVKSFWRKYNEEQIQVMSEEEVAKIVDAHLEQYITGWKKRNPNKDLPDLAKSTIADVRNKRTNISKSPKIARL
jgi:Mg2+/Co2+ transporter CorB